MKMIANFNLGLILGIVLGLVFTMLVLDNLYLRRKIFKLYERLMFEREKKATYRENSLQKSEYKNFKK